VRFISHLLPSVFLLQSVLAFSSEQPQTGQEHISKRIYIVGAGIIGATEALYAFKDAEAKGERISIEMFDKNADMSKTTAANITPSLTPDEIVSVVPRGQDLVEKLKIPFNQPGGIKVDDVPGVDNSVAQNFIRAALAYSKDDVGHAERTQTLLKMGAMSMAEWDRLYNEADSELRAIFDKAKFNRCGELKNDAKVLHTGYRADLIYGVPNAESRAMSMRKDYLNLGFAHTELLSADEVKKIDPALRDFVDSHSQLLVDGTRSWNNDATALYRPGGCINAAIFVPALHNYMKHKMGDRFKLNFNHKLVGIEIKDNTVAGLLFENGARTTIAKGSEVVLAPGEAVGTIDGLGLIEPAYAGFAGASLRLVIPLTEAQKEMYRDFDHCMEVHQEGIVLAWQARYLGGKLDIAVAGTKAFYGNQKPGIDQAFAKNRNLVQINMINDVLPQFMSIALGRNTHGTKISAEELQSLEDKKIARRWVGTRAVAYDGFPTLGAAYTRDGTRLSNARITTGLGSGGVSFAPAAALISRYAMQSAQGEDALFTKVLEFADSRRDPEQNQKQLEAGL